MLVVLVIACHRLPSSHPSSHPRTTTPKPLPPPQLHATACPHPTPLLITIQHHLSPCPSPQLHAIARPLRGSGKPGETSQSTPTPSPTNKEAFGAADAHFYLNSAVRDLAAVLRTGLGAVVLTMGARVRGAGRGVVCGGVGDAMGARGCVV